MSMADVPTRASIGFIAGARKWSYTLLPPVAPVGDAAARIMAWQADDPAEYCHRCGASVGVGEVTAGGCGNCRGRIVPWDRVWRLGAYTPPLDEWIIAMKFRRSWAWAPWLGRALAERIEEEAQRNDPQNERDTLETRHTERTTQHAIRTVQLILRRTQNALRKTHKVRSSHSRSSPSRPHDIVVPIPLHWKRRLSRGYDQSLLIAEAFAMRQGWPIARPIRRARHTDQQSGLPRSRRIENVRRAFVMRHGGLADRTVWLIDDVMTSGATAAQCARLLKNAGAGQVNLVVAAVTDVR